jgi:hypothetical protein
MKGAGSRSRKPPLAAAQALRHNGGMSDSDYFIAMFVGFVLTVAIETTVLLVLLSPRHSLKVRLFAGVWLTACTYPIVWLVLPDLFANRVAYLAVAETFAPVAECLIFWLAFLSGPTKPPGVVADEWSAIPQPVPSQRWATTRDMVAVVVANLASFGIGEVLHAFDFFPALLNLLH